ncbi:MAG: MarR family transcriptional regulator [Reinekea sp.]|nr:MarR family transcriptional regulator [Reinekea sp.]
MSRNKLKLENQICHSLYSATNALIRVYRPLLEKVDLTYPQYLVMLALWQEDQVMIKNLVERTRFDAGTLTPILKRLQTKGLIDLVKSAEDSRQKEVTVTESGRALADVAESIPDALTCQIDLTLEEAVALKQLSEKLYHTITSVN